jgi:hypothetical protein
MVTDYTHLPTTTIVVHGMQDPGRLSVEVDQAAVGTPRPAC